MVHAHAHAHMHGTHGICIWHACARAHTCTHTHAHTAHSTHTHTRTHILLLLQMGAGSGYWASALRLRGVSITAFDSRPPSREERGRSADGGDEQGVNEQGVNEYHAGCPSFVPVRRGTPATLAHPKWSTHTLLLCYPPPRGALHACMHPYAASMLPAAPGCAPCMHACMHVRVYEYMHAYAVDRPDGTRLLASVPRHHASPCG